MKNTINIYRFDLSWLKITDKEAEIIGERLKECPNLSELEWALIYSSALSFKFTAAIIGPCKENCLKRLNRAKTPKAKPEGFISACNILKIVDPIG